MARTTEELVAEIVEVDDTIDVAPFITAATSLVDQVAEQSSSPDDDQLTVIETWLAAHFYCVRDPRALMEKAGPVSATYQSRVGVGFDVTHYGQQAMRLDTSGYLAYLNSRKGKRRGRVMWVGTDPDA